MKPHSKRVGKIGNYTRNEWGRLDTTLETGGEDVHRSENQGDYYDYKNYYDQRKYKKGENLRSYWTTTKPWKLTVVLDY